MRAPERRTIVNHLYITIYFGRKQLFATNTPRTNQNQMMSPRSNKTSDSMMAAASDMFIRSLEYLMKMVWKTIVISVFAAVSTYWSYQFNLGVNLNGNDLVTVAVVYPLVFSVNAAYQRRQEALRSLATLKGHAFALRLCFAHWSKESRYSSELIYAADIILEKFFDDLKLYLSNHLLVPELEEEIISAFTALSLLNEKLRAEGVSSPEIAKSNEYIRNMLVEFECMKSIHVYRTPSSLLLYTKFFLMVIPIVYGPVFADIARRSGHVAYGMILAVLFAIVLTALDNTQDILENPYDGLSPDDIQFRKPTAILFNRVSRTWSEAAPHIQLGTHSLGGNSRKDSGKTVKGGDDDGGGGDGGRGGDSKHDHSPADGGDGGWRGYNSAQLSTSRFAAVPRASPAHVAFDDTMV